MAMVAKELFRGTSQEPQANKSNNLLKQRLIIRVNGTTALTEKGKMALELVRVDTLLKHHRALDVNFAMADEMVKECSFRRDLLSGQLGMPSDREKYKQRLRRYKRRLTKNGFPYWKVA